MGPLVGRGFQMNSLMLKVEVCSTLPGRGKPALTNHCSKYGEFWVDFVFKILWLNFGNCFFRVSCQSNTLSSWPSDATSSVFNCAM